MPGDHHAVSANDSKAINPAQNPKVEHRVREFLKALNSGGGKPIETLTPAEARQVLVDDEASVPLDLPPCGIEAKTVTQEGLRPRRVLFDSLQLFPDGRTARIRLNEVSLISSAPQLKR